jgi:hypothetical protein
MKIVSMRKQVLRRLKHASDERVPLLCPNAETPDEIEGILTGASLHAKKAGRSSITIGLGITGSYPDHSKLGFLAGTGSAPEADLESAAAARRS